MKKNRTSFDQKQRQSQWAIIFIVIRFLIKFLKQLWPILLALALGRGANGFEQYEIIAAGIGGLSMVSSIIAYFKYYFHISDEELVIEKGIFKKVRLDLPFDRIQSVNFEQNFLHQMLNVTAVEIESAGSEQKELKIDALKIPIAEKLREEILRRKGQAVIIESTSGVDKPLSAQQKKSILTLATPDLIRVGLTQNHLRPIGLLFSLTGSVFAYGWTVGWNPIDVFWDMFTRVIESNPFAYAPLLLLLIPLMLLYSLITTVLRHYDLDFSRIDRRFHIVQGLFNRQQFSALDKKIQIMSWGQNPLEKKLGFHNILFRQARSGDKKKNKMRFEIPGCSEEQVKKVQRAWLKKTDVEFDIFHSVSPHLFKHSAKYQGLLYLFLVALMTYLKQYYWVAFLLFWTILSLYLTHKKYIKTKYAINDHNLFIGGGILGFKNSICPLYKIQNVAITQNYYQSKRELASLQIFTAAGAMIIPYISEQRAQNLCDLLIMKVQCSKKSWM